MGPNRFKYLEILQATIGRMATSQFALRAWSVGLGTGVIAFSAAKDSNLKIAVLAAVSAVVYWMLDSYYLVLEWNFRAIFRRARAVDDDAPDFAMDVQWNKSELLEAAIRPAVWLVHAPVFILASIIGGRAWLG
jgi:amino acid permease